MLYKYRKGTCHAVSKDSSKNRDKAENTSEQNNSYEIKVETLKAI